MKAVALALAILLAASGSSAKADVLVQPAEPPVPVAMALPERPDGPVLDEADLLPPDAEAALDKRLRDYWDKNRTAVMVVSVNSLGGAPIDQFSLELARTWDIGDKENLRGLLVLVAPNERGVRIEVSCGLENVITDEFAAVVIEERMTPEFRTGNLGKGTLAGVNALIEQLDAGANPAPVSEGCSANMRKAA